MPAPSTHDSLDWDSGSRLRAAFHTDSEEFLLREFDHLAAAVLSNEESGERRVNIFLGLIAAFTAGLGFGADAVGIGRQQLPFVVLVAGLTLFGFGFLTLRRIMGRNIHTRALIESLRRIRIAFVWRHPEALHAVGFAPETTRVIKEKPNWGPGQAGLLETVALTNCLLLSASAAAVYWLAGGTNPVPTVLICFWAAAIAWFAQMAWARSVYDRTQADEAEKRAEALRFWADRLGATDPGFRSGVGLVILDDRGRVLAFERSDVPRAWQLPQGGLGPDEAVVDGAWRELEEETGLGPDHLDLVDHLEPWLGYELPPSLRSLKTGRGQVHSWCVFRLRDSVGALPPLPEGGEFGRHRWMEMEDLVASTVEFRRPVYGVLQKELAALRDSP